MVWLGSPESNQLRKRFERFGRQVVLDVLDLAVDCVRVQPKKLEKLRESLVTRFDMLGYLASGKGQSKAPVSFIIDETAARKPANHVRNRRSAQVQTRRKICNARVTFLID